jgi:hypothetical protein
MGRDEIVHHLLADVGIGTPPFGRAEVDASGEALLSLVQQGIREGLPLDHFALMPCQIGPILLESHPFGWPAPRTPKIVQSRSLEPMTAG